MATSPQENTLINAAQNPTGKNLTEFANLPMQNIPIPEGTQQLAQQTFESQVRPLRKGFQERIETTTGELARRGIAFGGATGPGATQVRNLIEAEQELEAQIAGDIGTAFGQTLLEQAFQSSEAAKRFQESKEFAEFSQGLSFGLNEQGQPITQLEAQKQLAEFASDLDVEAQTQLAGLDLENKKTLYEFTTNLDQTTQKDFAQFMANLDNQTQKDFLTFSTNLDVQAKKDLATFMTNMDTAAQKDMASFMSNLNTEQAKELATFTSALDISTQKELSTFAQSLRGGVDDQGNPLTDVQIAQQMAEIADASQQTMLNFQAGLNRGVNPDTGQPYTDFEMANLAANLEMDRAERQAEIQKEVAEYATILDRGTDEDGNPLTQLAFAELSTRMQNDLNAEFARTAFENAAIQEFGENGVQIANDLAQVRGDSMTQDLLMLNAIDVDPGLTDAEKQDITNLIMSGAGWESEPVRALLLGSNSQTASADFIAQPDAQNTLRNASTELKDYLASQGFGYEWTREGGFLGLGESYGWDMNTDDDSLNRFTELWETSPEFRRMVKKG